MVTQLQELGASVFASNQSMKKEYGYGIIDKTGIKTQPCVIVKLVDINCLFLQIACCHRHRESLAEYSILVSMQVGAGS